MQEGKGVLRVLVFLNLFSHSYLSGLLLHWSARKEISTQHQVVRPLALYKWRIPETFLQNKRMTDCTGEKRYQSSSQFCFTCKISDASLQRLCSIITPWGSLFQILQFPRCIQDLYIVSLLFQAVSADCFLFKHKSHILTPNCCVCLFLQISLLLLHLLNDKIMHIQE